MIDNPHNFDDNLEFYSSTSSLNIKIPYVTERVAAGFPSHADGYIDDELDINEYLIRNPESTFLVKVNGDSMINAGIQTGDMLVVDKSCGGKNNDVIIACVNGEFTVKRLLKMK